jgi:hypothetical protein
MKINSIRSGEESLRDSSAVPASHMEQGSHDGGTSHMKAMVWCGILVLVAMSVSCKKSEPSYGPPATPPPFQSGGMPGAPPGNAMTTAPADIPKIEGGGVTVIPDAVKGKWKAVVLVVEDKGQKQNKEYTVQIGKSLEIPNSKLTVDVVDFLPDLKIENSTFTSTTNEPNNPAVHVIVKEEGKEVFKGWLFSLFPTIHPFQHVQFSVTLKEGVPS